MRDDRKVVVRLLMGRTLNLYKLYALAFLLATAIGISYAGYSYISNLQQEAVASKIKVAELQKSLDIVNEQSTRIAEAQRKLNEQLTATRQQNNLLEKKLEESRLKSASIAKPQAVERIINNASNKSLRCFELLSGSELTEKERKAKNANEFNSECPWLYNKFIISK